MAYAGDESPIDFTTRFKELVDTVYPRSLGRPNTAGEISRGIADLGGTVSQNYIISLLNGRRKKPSLEIVQWICKYYSVPLDYFYAADNSEQLRKMKMLADLRDAGVQNIAQLAVGLDEENLRTVEDLVRSLRKRQGLEDGEQGTK